MAYTLVLTKCDYFPNHNSKGPSAKHNKYRERLVHPFFIKRYCDKKIRLLDETS